MYDKETDIKQTNEKILRLYNLCQVLSEEGYCEDSKYEDLYKSIGTVISKIEENFVDELEDADQ